MQSGLGRATSDYGIYEGALYYDTCHGYGTMQWFNGDIFEGDWKENQPYGKGTYTSSDGSVYIGEFVNGKRHGRGRQNWQTGDWCEGYWKNDIFSHNT